MSCCFASLSHGMQNSTIATTLYGSQRHSVTPKSLEEIGKEFGFDGEGEYCHSGMLSGAQNIYEDLMRHKILDKAMEEHPDYGLRIVGHSLGAGVAASEFQSACFQLKRFFVDLITSLSQSHFFLSP